MNISQNAMAQAKQKFLSFSYNSPVQCSRSMDTQSFRIQASWNLCHLHKGAPAIPLPAMEQRRSRRERRGADSLMHASLLLTLCWQKLSCSHSSCKGSWEMLLCPSTALLPLLRLCPVILRSSAPGTPSTGHLTVLFQAAAKCPCQVRAAVLPLTP